MILCSLNQTWTSSVLRCSKEIGALANCVHRLWNNSSYQLESIHLGLTYFSLPFLFSAPALKGQYNSNWAEGDGTPSLDASSNSSHKINPYELLSACCSVMLKLVRADIHICFAGTNLLEKMKATSATEWHKTNSSSVRVRPLPENPVRNQSLHSHKQQNKTS